MVDSITAMTLQQQIDDLQSRLAYQEDLLQSLNILIASQDTTIRWLQEQLQKNKKRLDNVTHNLSATDSEKPPHY